MHQTRQEVTKRMPIERKGTKYVARSLGELSNSVPVVIALRDMLHLATTAQEARQMIYSGKIKINGRKVKDYREDIKLFNIFEADKIYRLTILQTGKFALEETKEKKRLCKVMNRKVLSGTKMQINLSDGSNFIGDKKIEINDSVYLDFDGKVKEHIKFGPGKEAFVLSGQYSGKHGKIKEIKGKKIIFEIKDEGLKELDSMRVIAL